MNKIQQNKTLSAFKVFIRQSSPYRLFRRFEKASNNKKILKIWSKSGRPSPPPQAYKHLVIKEFASKNSIGVLVETGTFMGDSIDACMNLFKKIFSIELDQHLYEAATKRFEKEKHITLYLGDSGEQIGKVLASLRSPCLFWLDGHYSEGFTAKGKLNTPIIEELTQIFSHPIKTHVILVDDARCFTGKDDYPTLEYLREFVKSHNPNLQFTVEYDIIRIHI